MSIIPLRSRAHLPPAAPASPPYAQFTAFRSHMLAAWRVWLATSPPADLVQAEADATASALRQIDELTRGTGT